MLARSSPAPSMHTTQASPPSHQSPEIGQPKKPQSILRSVLFHAHGRPAVILLLGERISFVPRPCRWCSERSLSMQAKLVSSLTLVEIRLLGQKPSPYDRARDAHSAKFRSQQRSES